MDRSKRIIRNRAWWIRAIIVETREHIREGQIEQSGEGTYITREIISI